jgi:hypothetical protein
VLNLKDIVFEDGDFFVVKVAKGFEVYRSGVTHPTRCAQIGFEGQPGLDRCKAEINRRKAA